MTPERLLKLDAIKRPEDLTWREASYDAGDPKCLCSACGEKIYDFAIRMYDGTSGPTLQAPREAVLHANCFQYLHSKQNNSPFYSLTHGR